MPALDSLLVMVVVGLVVLGALVGSIRQLLFVVSVYGAAMIAGQSHPYLAIGVKAIVGEMATIPVLEGASLMVLFLLGTALLYWGLNSVFPDTRPTSERARRLDRVFGGILGLVGGLLFVAAFYAALGFLVQSRWPSGDITRLSLRDQVEHSVLQPAVAMQTPIVYVVLKPWFPRGLRGFPAD